MTMQRAWRSGSLALLVAVVTTHGASAQDARPCDQIKEPPLSDAIVEARRYLAERWLVVGDNFYIAYRMKSPAANPFDLTRPKEREKTGAKTKDSEEGYIWVGNLQCVLAGAQDNEVLVSFVAGASSFVERQGAWTPPMRQRELTQIALTKRDTTWVASERRGDYSLLAAEDELRQPASAEIPPRNKHTGIPCDAQQVWNGKRCVAARTGARQQR
jgi:hypothetical protein